MEQSEKKKAGSSHTVVATPPGDLEYGSIEVPPADSAILNDLGYKQELKRSFSLISMVGFCFSILTCWSAVAGTLSQVFLNGGPVALVWGWVVASVLSIFVGLSLADICSAYPVSGGQYSWCLFLAGGPESRWGRLISYACGWIQLAGLVCMGASPQLGYFVAGLATLNSKDESFDPSNWKVALIFYGFLVLFGLINIFANKILHYMSTFALYWSITVFLVCMITTLACAAPDFQPASLVFTKTIDTSGWNKGMTIIIGSMQVAYCLCLYDSPAHMSEELMNAARDAPRAMVLSIFIGIVTGLTFIIALLFSLTDLEGVADTATGLPIVEVFNQAVGKTGAIVLTSFVILCESLSTNSLITEGSRSIYAFARDGAFPFGLNKWLMYVSPTLGVPVPAILLCIGFQFAFVAILFGSSAAFGTVLDMASCGIYVSYLFPIVTYMFCPNGKPKGYYNLGRWTTVCHVPAVLYLTFCIIFFFFPTELPVTGENMNYCCVAVGITAILGIVSWFGGARKTYATGSSKTSLEKQQMEAKKI